MRARRRELGLTVRELAERTLSSPSYISGLENNKYKQPSADAVERIAKSLDFKPADLHIDDPEPERPVVKGAPLTYLPEEASAYLGGVVSPEWLRRKAREGEIPSSTITGSNRVCFTEADLRSIVQPRVSQAA